MNQVPFVGRNDVLASPQAEMLAVIGRRRVGKTFLVQSFYNEVLDVELMGIEHARRSEQLQNFTIRLRRYAGCFLDDLFT